MSVDVSVMIGIGFKIPYEDIEELDEKLDEFDYYSCTLNQVQVVADGMCGNYAYIMRLDHEIDEIWCENHCVINSLLTENEIEIFKKIYNIIYPDKEFDTSLIKPVVFLHHT